jgi:hypothetical protein
VARKVVCLAIDHSFRDGFDVSRLMDDGEEISFARLGSTPLKGVGHLVWGDSKKLRF